MEEGTGHTLKSKLDYRVHSFHYALLWGSSVLAGGTYSLVYYSWVWVVRQGGPVNLFNSRAQNQKAHLSANICHACTPAEPLSMIKIIFWFSTCLFSVLSNLIRTWTRKNTVRQQASSEMPKVMDSGNVVIQVKK